MLSIALQCRCFHRLDRDWGSSELLEITMTRLNHTAIGEAVVHFHKLEKQGADTPDLSYGLTGRLYLTQSGWLMLSVPNALGRGAFQALNVPGAELPLQDSTGQYNAHISVMRPEEILKIGGPDKVLERGKEFSFTLGPVREVNPEGWDEMERAWFIQVRSPDLEKLRKTYGLSPLPNNNKYDFHITFAVRRKGVTRNNNLMMRRVGDMIRNPSKYFDDKYTRKTASTGWEVKDSAIHGKGLFATKEFGPADVIASGGHFAPDGTFVRSDALKPINHSKRPNTVVRLEDDELVLVADDLITPGEELTLDYVDAYSVLGIDVQFEDGSGIESNNDVLEKKSENRWLKVIREVVEDDSCADAKSEDCRPNNNPQPPRSSPRSPSKDQQAQIQRSAIEEQQSSQKLAASDQDKKALSFEFVCSGCGQLSGDCAGCPGNIQLVPAHEFKKKAAELDSYEVEAFKKEPLIGRPGADISNYLSRLQSRANRIQKEELASSRMQAALKGDFGYSQSRDYWAGRTPQRPKLLHQLTDMAMRRNAGR